MSEAISRTEALELLEKLRHSWSSGDWKEAGFFLAAKVVLHSSHKGVRVGSNAVIEAFDENIAADELLELVTSNYYVTYDGYETAMISAYLYGEKSVNNRRNLLALFGAVVRLTAKTVDGKWKITHVLINNGWIEGEPVHFSGWTLPQGEKGWRPGDAPPVLVSELDSPWVCISNNVIISTEEEQIAESYSRYSWGIDQNDFGQFKSCYTEDACGQFPPLGPLSGLHNIVGSLKEFRRHWPWMQHFGVPLKITVDSDNKTAEMWIGRLIPGRIKNENGDWMYGAHYRIELRKEYGLWKFSWSEYVPGWFSEHDMPFKTPSTP